MDLHIENNEMDSLDNISEIQYHDIKKPTDFNQNPAYSDENRKRSSFVNPFQIDSGLNTKLNDCVWPSLMKKSFSFVQIKDTKWCHSDAIIAENKSDLTEVWRSSNKKSQDWQYILGAFHIQTDTLFEITITGIKEDNRYMPIGIVDELGYEQITKNNFILKLPTRAIWASGYTKSLNLTGTMLPHGRTDKNGFRIGLKVYLNVSLSESIVSIFDEDKSFDLKTEHINFSSKYFVFIQMMFPDCAFQIKQYQRKEMN